MLNGKSWHCSHAISTPNFALIPKPSRSLIIWPKLTLQIYWPQFLINTTQVLWALFFIEWSHCCRCTCSHCPSMDTEDESVCCREMERVMTKVSTHGCITQHPDFVPACTNPTVLEIAYLQYKQYHGRMQKPLHQWEEIYLILCLDHIIVTFEYIQIYLSFKHIYFSSLKVCAIHMKLTLCIIYFQEV